MRSMDAGHVSTRRALSLLACVLIVVGVFIAGSGLLRFSSVFRTTSREFFDRPREVMDNHRENGFSGIFFLGLGGISLAGGLTLLSFAQRGRVARYTANEIAPVATDTFNYVARGSREGLETVRDAVGSPRSSETIKVRCRSCGYLESDDARFCSGCAKAI